MTSLAIKYYRGNGVDKDYAKAFELATKSAEQGDASAQYLLGVLYANGLSVDTDYILAHMWFDVAVKIGWSENGTYSVKGYMSVDEVQKAKMLAKECVVKQFRNCDFKEELPLP